MNAEVKQKELEPEYTRADRLRSLSWALILIWAGLVFLADNTGLLERLSLRGSLDVGFAHPSAWTLILLGAGFIVLLEVFLRAVLPGYSTPNAGRLILAAVLIGIGLSNLLRSDLIWPLVIIGIGVSILAGSVLRKNSI